MGLLFISGSLHESLGHERLKAYVCVLYDSPCAPLLLPWLGEVEGTSLAMSQAKASPSFRYEFYVVNPPPPPAALLT